MRAYLHSSGTIINGRTVETVDSFGGITWSLEGDGNNARRLTLAVEACLASGDRSNFVAKIILYRNVG